MKNKKIFMLLITFILVSLAYAGENSCVNCHTDETLLKKLVKVPHLENAEGEG